MLCRVKGVCSGCVFDKDNTLTHPFKTDLHAEAAEGLMSCKKAFGDSVVLFSNSAGLVQYDPEGKSVGTFSVNSADGHREGSVTS